MADKAITYDPINWKDYPDTSTPVSAENLGKMDAAIDALNDVATTLQGTTKNHQDRIAAIETNKPETTYVKELIKTEAQTRASAITQAKQDANKYTDEEISDVNETISNIYGELYTEIKAIKRYLGI